MDQQHLEDSTPRSEKARRLDEKLRRELGPVVCAALEEPDVVEIMRNANGWLWVERLGQGMIHVGEMSAVQAESAITTVASTLRATITADNPILECELPLDGSRFEALIPPVVSSPVFTIRRKASRVFTLDDYVRQKVMTERQAARLVKAVEDHENILIVGGTGSGKTTLTNGVIAEMTRQNVDERIVIIEDTAELQCNAPNAVILRATDTVDMQRLLKASMRLRPDRILVGEVRGGEALTLLKSWGTGHPGGVGTLHSFDAKGGLLRLQQLIAEVTVTPMGFLIGEAVDLVVSIARTASGRRVNEVVAVQGFENGEYILTTEE